MLRLLEENGGRVKQQRIAGELDWTDAKTSQVVGNLREDDAVETFRIGRENVVTLPEESDL
ncbi:helix-turn-helix transcriptional regulator [Halosimplex aquaticum]